MEECYSEILPHIYGKIAARPLNLFNPAAEVKEKGRDEGLYAISTPGVHSNHRFWNKVVRGAPTLG